jgi:hypothetical protein
MMATLPQEFIDLAAELIGDEFAAFASDAVIVRAGEFDPDTQTNVTESQTIPMIRLEFKESSFNGQLVMVGDYLLIGEYQKLDWLPSADNSTVTHDAIVCNLVRAETDPAKATIILHVRRA